MKIKHFSFKELKDLNLIKKRPCIKCGDMATWFYVPADKIYSIDEYYFCDGCIPRGCGCQENYETSIPNTDEWGRLLPCVEYDYSEEGFED